MGAKLVTSIATGLLTLALTYFWRGFPLRLAVLSGVSVGLLVYSTFQASARLRRMYRK
ncbi:MAG: hypothetical protein R3190_11325 [Thermoanaerobaculia bacterium]|nr:hypothetical protein [Thermoanaerobaculia bacterium]